MKVHELIEALTAFNPDAEVYTEGCDCEGESNKVIVWTEGNVLIARYEDTEKPRVYEEREPLRFDTYEAALDAVRSGVYSR